MSRSAIRWTLWPLAFGLVLSLGCKADFNSGSSGSDSDIRASTSTDDGITWSAPVAVNKLSGKDRGDDGRPQLATDALGTWLSVWNTSSKKKKFRDDFDIAFSRSTNLGANWGGHDDVNTNSGKDKHDDFWPYIATDRQGTWITTWYSDASVGGKYGNDFDILYARSVNAGNTWTKPAALNRNAATDTGPDYRPTLTTDGMGTWIATWYSFDSLDGALGTDADILFARSISGGASWTAPAALNTNAATDEGNDRRPQIATDGSGNWVAVWSSTDSLGDTIGTGTNVLVARSTDNGVTWSAPAPLNTNAKSSAGSHTRPRVITDGLGNWTAAWQSNDPLSDGFGNGVTGLGDLDGDGVEDVAVAASGDDDGGTDRGAVWILFLNTDGTVKSQQKISDTQGGFTGTLSDGDLFGHEVASLGDLDGDMVGDLAVGAVRDDGGGLDRGAVWILFMNMDGTVKSHQKIGESDGGFTGSLDDLDSFGGGVTSLGDLDKDGVGDLGVGALGDDGGGTNRGAMWILFLNTNGTVKSHQKISDTAGGFTGVLSDFDKFGHYAASLGDLDGDTVIDLVVSETGDDFFFPNRGAVWILFMNTDGTVKSHQKISDTDGSFTGPLDAFDSFGIAPSSLGDLDGDGVVDIAVGARNDDDGDVDSGAVWILFLNADGTVKAQQKISATQGSFTGTHGAGDRFSKTAALGDVDGDGIVDLAVGGRAGLWILNLAPNGTVQSEQPIDANNGGFTGSLADDLGTDYDILTARSTDNGATWTAPTPLNSNADSDTGVDAVVQVQTGGPGTWLAVWHSFDALTDTIGTDSDILIARSVDAGATWTAPAALNTDADIDDEDDFYPQVTTDGLGKWVAVWEHEDPR
ncbi:MAG: FG-GAP repeat protein [Myxococcales bacterium]|nr:FG-GAP repeat protein [Myxococcales bacterium]